MAIDDLNDLRLFAGVVANGGFSAAARALAIPKSRISRRITALEDELGVRLVERSTRRFSVTEIGLDVYRHARAALAQADTIEEAAARLRAEPQGLVRLSCPPDADRLIANGLPAFLAANPKVRLQLIISNRRVNLIEEGVDVAVRVRERLDTDADLQIKIVGHPVSQLVASHALVKELGEPSNLIDLERFPTLGFAEVPGPERWMLLGPNNEEFSFVHEPRLAASNFSFLRQAAIDGLGVAYLPELQFRAPVGDGRLQIVLPQWKSPQSILHLVYTSRRGLLPAVRAVIDFAAAALDLRSPAWSPR